MDNIVRLNIGGTRVEISTKTLIGTEENFFHALLLSPFQHLLDKEGYIFIDRNGELFHHILLYLREGSIIINENEYEKLLLEAEFYMLPLLASELKKLIEKRIQTMNETQRKIEKLKNMIANLKDTVRENDKHIKALEKGTIPQTLKEPYAPADFYAHNVLIYMEYFSRIIDYEAARYFFVGISGFGAGKDMLCFAMPHDTAEEMIEIIINKKVIMKRYRCSKKLVFRSYKTKNQYKQGVYDLMEGYLLIGRKVSMDYIPTPDEQVIIEHEFHNKKSSYHWE